MHSWVVFVVCVVCAESYVNINSFRLVSAPVSSPRIRSAPLAMAKKNKNKHKGSSQAPSSSRSEKQGRADQFDALTRQFMFTMNKVSKTIN